MIHQHLASEVFDTIDTLLDAHAPAPSYRRFFDRALGIVRESAGSAPVFLPADLPLAAADLLGSPHEDAILAAAASTLVWAGADLMDDAADGELPEAWHGVSGSQIALVATNLLSTLPHLLMSRCAPGVAAAYSQALSRTLFVMSDGQSADLTSADSVQTVDDYLALVRRKSGAEFALFASTPAILAARPAETVAAWVRFGFAYGTMIQVSSDTFSTLTESGSNDLELGKRTLPVLLTLDRASDGQHRSFLADLDLAAQGDQLANARIVGAMTESGAVRTSIERGELLRFRASEALPVRLAEVAQDHPIRTLLRAYSLL